MKFYDISKNLFSEAVYKGDPKPRYELLKRIDAGDEYNLSAFYACTHNSTHLDAPKHCFQDGKAIDEIDLQVFFGPCTVFSIKGIITGQDIEYISKFSKKRILIHGNGESFISQSAAFELVNMGCVLIGTDAQSISLPGDDIVHRELLNAGVIILEGLNLKNIEDGNYILSSFPIKLNGLEGALTRAVLMRD